MKEPRLASDESQSPSCIPETQMSPESFPSPESRWKRVFNKRRLGLAGIDILCFCFAYLLNAVLLALSVGIAYADILTTWPAALIILLAVGIGRVLLGVYQNVWRYPNVKAYMTMIAADLCCGAMGFALSVVLVELDILPLRVGFWQALCTITLFSLSTLTLRFGYQLYHAGRAKARMAPRDRAINIAILGAGQVGANLADEIRRGHESEYRPVCFIDNDRTKIGQRVADLPVFAEDGNVLQNLRKLGVKEIILTISKLSVEESQRIVTIYSSAGFAVKFRNNSVRSIDEADGKHPFLRNIKPEDLLGRPPLSESIKTEEIRTYYRDRTVLITGGGGSIGSELCRQIAKLEPRRLIIVDIYENNAYDIEQELRREYGKALDLVVEIASVRDKTRMECIFKHYRPQVVFHAAAHKHVPLMEHSACEVVKNNVMGTYNVADVAEAFGTEKFVLISTDKAVNPTNVMGASKRMCEMIVQCRTDSQTAFTAVRFGNVLGSNGSVIPLFQRQISAGGPVTVTDKRIIRYFMTIAEASCLVLTAGAMAKDGELFVLDMGTEMKIWTLAENLIRLMGYRPHEDIQIVETGLRPGEKLYEETLTHSESATKTENELIYIEKDIPLSRAEVDQKIDLLLAAVKEAEGDITSEPVKAALHRVIPTFKEPDEVNKNVNKEKLNALSGVQN